MYITIITTNDYDLNTKNIRTDIENITNIFVSALLLTIACGLSFLCLMSLLVYTLIKTLFNNE